MTVFIFLVSVCVALFGGIVLGSAVTWGAAMKHARGLLRAFEVQARSGAAHHDVTALIELPGLQAAVREFERKVAP